MNKEIVKMKRWLEEKKEELKNTPLSNTDERFYLECEIDKLEESIREMEGYQYLSDNDIDY